MSPFSSRFSRLRLWQGLGRIAAALAAGIAAAAAVWLLFGLLDALAGLPVGARVAGTVTAAVIAGGLTLLLLVRALRFSSEQAAAEMDRLSGAPRRPVSAALGLDPDCAETPLARWLAGRAVAEAADALTTLTPRAVLPRRELRLAAGALILTLLTVAGIWMAHREAFATVAGRLLHPATDLPPWSRLRFSLEPAAPAANYGGEALLTVTCSERPEEAVECLVRIPRTGETLRLPASREADRRFSRRLESLTEPVEVAFASGRARSGWTPLEIRYQPRVLSGRLLVEPPAWLEQQSASFPLDAPEVTVPEGSRLTLTLTSNRPLGGGAMVLTPAAGNTGAVRSVDAVLSGTHEAAFSITATGSGTLAATLRDIRGTPAEEPLILPLTVIPDQAPAVDLASPPPVLLATPNTKVPIQGSAEDDHGLSRVRLVRTLAGFRDRPLTVAPALRDRRFDFADALELAPLGLLPGQTIEVYLEAADHNPSLLGQTSSGVSRVHIISEDDYAARLRAQTTLKEFAARFNAAQQAMQEAREALERLDEALGAGDPAAVTAAKEAASSAQEKAAELMEKLADDFPAYEMEKRLKDLAAAAAAPLQANLADLEALPADSGEAKAAVAAMKARLAKPGDELGALRQDAEQVAKAGRLLEMASRFRRVYETQQSLVRRIGTIVEEMRQGSDQNRRLLPSLADTQEKNREALNEFATELRQRVGELPDDDPMLTPMRDSAMEFLEALETADPGSAMDAATSAGRGADIHDMLRSAELARSILERLMQPQSPFGQACRGQCPTFKVPLPDLNQTLAQLLEGMNRQGSSPGSGPGAVPGQGGPGMAGGSGADGSPMPGFASVDLPVLGPSRMSFDAPSSGGGGGKDGRGPGGSGLPVKAEQATLKPGELRSGDTPPPATETVPEAYRDAVKRYFTPPSAAPSSR